MGFLTKSKHGYAGRNRDCRHGDSDQVYEKDSAKIMVESASWQLARFYRPGNEITRRRLLNPVAKCLLRVVHLMHRVHIRL